LHYWATIASFNCFGDTAVGARLPVALAMVASVALTFLIGERLGGYWRGFVAGLIHLCALGSFIWARMATPEPLFAACLGATILCVVGGYQEQRKRRLWFAAAWACVALGCLTKGAVALIFPGAIFLVLALFFREARLRFRLLFHWLNLLIFLAIVVPWFVWLHFRDPTFLSHLASSAWVSSSAHLQSLGGGAPLFRFVASHFAWWFPAVPLILPGVFLGWRKVFRPHEFEFADALPLCWMAVGFLPLLFFSQRQYFDSISMWSALALVAAAAWERTPRALRLAGLALTAMAGLALAGTAGLDLTRVLPELPPSWLGVRSVLALAGLSIVAFSLLAAYFSWRDRETLAITLLLLGMVPMGLSAAEGLARYGRYLSFADAAEFLQPRLGSNGEILFEGSAPAGSSLKFYLDRPPIMVTAKADGNAAIEELADTHPVYFIIPRDRVPYWQERLTERFHIFHQEAVCGAYVIVSNQP
jgi:4-amino-4-deoxy-L-arabinose transferase-like glycosyltransferase